MSGIVLIISLGLGVIISYWIPSWAVQSQKRFRFIHWKWRWLMISLFLFFTALSWMKWKTSMEFYLFVPCLLVLLLIAMTDYWFGLIPNIFTYPAIIALCIARWWIQPTLSFNYFFAMLLGGLSVFLIAVLTKAIGIGDAKLVGLGGLMVGLPDILLAFWLATISGTIYIVWRWVIGRNIKRKEPFPFGPHLAVGIAITYLYSDPIFWVFTQSWFYPIYHVIS